MTHLYDTGATYLYNLSAAMPAAGAKTSQHTMAELFNGPTHPGFVTHSLFSII
jgi:hypothetical protein